MSNQPEPDLGLLDRLAVWLIPALDRPEASPERPCCVIAKEPEAEA